MVNSPDALQNPYLWPRGRWAAKRLKLWADEMRRALAAGARSFLLKSMPASDLFAAIRQVHAGKKHIPTEIAVHLAEHLGEDALSQREVEVISDYGNSQ